MKYYIHIILLATLIYFTSCATDEECRKNKDVNFVSKLYHVTYVDSTGVYKYSTLTIDSITIQGLTYDTLTNSFIPIDSILYNNTKRVSSFTLDLNKSSNQSKYLIRFNDVSDTITINHTNYDYYMSLECGCIKTFTIDTILVTNNFIDSIKITNHTINNVNAEHLYIYN